MVEIKYKIRNVKTELLRAAIGSGHSRKLEILRTETRNIVALYNYWLENMNCLIEKSIENIIQNNTLVDAIENVRFFKII